MLKFVLVVGKEGEVVLVFVYHHQNIQNCLFEKLLNHVTKYFI